MSIHRVYYRGDTALLQPNKLFSKIPEEDFDLATFLAIVQSIPDARILPLTPIFKTKYSKYGSSGQVCLPGTNITKEGVAFKRFHGISDSEVFQAATCEVIVLEHPAFRQHPNVVNLLGVVFDVYAQNGVPYRVLPCLALELSELGSLSKFLDDTEISTYQKLMFCLDIGNAIRTLHEFNIIHGDIKPENVLVFPRDSGEAAFVAKITDFETSCFGCADDSPVTLRFTKKWKAPEIQQAGQKFSLEEAKKTDIFSYGKLCQSILPSDISGCSPKLKLFFERSCNNTVADRASIGELLDNLTALISQYRKTPEGHNEHSIFTLHVSPNPIRGVISLCSQRFSSLRARIGRTLGATMSDESSEFYAHGQVQVRFLSRRVMRVVSLFLLSLVFALIYTAMMVDYRKSIKNKKYSNSTNKRRLIAMNVFIGVHGTLLVYLIAGLCYTPYGWIELGPMLRPFAIFGQRKHIVPHLPTIFPVLNQVHFFVREMLVMCLERRLEWNCEECRSRAHVQLAWAHYTAFGTPQNLERARLLVNKGGKSERHFRQLCGEANFWDYACQRSYGLSRKWEENKYDGQTDKGMASWFRAEGMEIAIDTLQAEFGGKKALNMALYSQINLAFTLASIHYAMADFENAELFHREVIVLHREMKNRETKLSPYRRLGFTPDLEDLVKVLGEQGKIHEGILELKNNTTAARNPNGKRKNFLIWLFQGQTGEDIPHRHALVKLYLQQEDTCALARIDLLGDLQDLQTKKEVQHRFKERSFYLVGQFARLMATQGHSDQASLILEERMKHMDDILGDDTNAETKARRQDALVFSQSMKHVKLAIDIQKQLLENDISQETAPEGSLALRMEYAFSLAQQGFIDEASKMCRYVLDVRATLEISESSYVVWECLEDFCGSIWYHNPGEWTRQSLMQKQLLEECEKSGDPVLKVKLLSILCLTTRRNGYEMIIERLRTLPSTLTSSLPDTLVVKLKIQCMLVFVLSSRGLAHESRKDLEEACTTAKDMLESLPSRSEMSKTGNLNTLAFVHRTATLAYLNKLVFLCHYEGFGQNCGKDDIGFMQEAISRHEDAVKEICSESHIHTLYARIQLATALYYVGHAMQNGTEFLRAKSLYEEVLLSKTREVGEPDEFPISEIPSVIISARLTRLEFEMGTTTIRKCNESNRAVRTLYNGWDSSHLARVAILIGYSEIDEDGVLEDSCLRDINMATRDFAKSRRRYHVNAEHHPDILKAWTMLSSLQSLSPGLSFLRAAANAAKLLHLKDEGLINPVTVKYRSILANGLFRHKATMAAGLQLYTEVLESEKTIFGELHTRTIASQRRLAMMHLKDDARDLARLLLHTALSNAVKLLGHGHTITLRVWECLLKVEGAEASDMEHKVERILHAIVGGRILKHRYQRLSAHLLLLVQAVQSGLRYHPFSVSIKEIMELIQHERYGINEEDASIIGRELEALLKTTLLA